MSHALCLVFFASGAAALIFETLWFRQAGLAFGNSVWATSLVLSSFMAGLALGNGLAARIGHRARRPILAYAILEVWIAASALALVLLFPVLTEILAPLFQPFLDRPWLLNPLRLLISFALLLVPATAMGATLPLLVRALYARNPNFGDVLGRLYGWNTLGAVVGAFAGEGLLIGWLGVIGTGAAAASLYVLAAATAAIVWRLLAPAPLAVAPPRPAAAPAFTARARRLLTATFLAGAVLLGLEVIWFRLLSLFVYVSSLAFAVMLSVVLAGIGAGGLAASAWLRRHPAADRHVPALALAAGALALALYAAFGDLMAFFFGGTLEGGGALYVAHPVYILMLAVPLMLPTSLLSGMLFTLIGHSAREELFGEVRTAGLVTLSNTLGGVLGSLLAGFFLLPWLGVESSLVFLALSYTGVALASAPRGLPRSAARSGHRPHALVAAATALALAVVLFPYGKMRGEYLLNPARAFLAKGLEIEAVREGVSETLIYLRRDRLGQRYYHRMLTNGYSMATNATVAKRYMKLFVYLPTALHPEPRDALLISYGMGSTADALVKTRSLERIDVVDISRDALRMSRLLFPPEVTFPLDDPRVNVHVEDGRFFLQVTDRRFDLVTAEPPPPKAAGVVNLYTREYYALIRNRLRPGGVASYWLPAHLIDEHDTRAIIRAFCDVFPDCSLWNGNALDWMLVGTRELTGRVREADFRRQWNDPVVGPELRALGFEEPEQLGALFLGDANDLTELTRGTPPLVDNWPQRLSPRASVLAEDTPFYLSVIDVAAARERFARSELIRNLWPRDLREKSFAYFRWQGHINRVLDSIGVGIMGSAPGLEALHRVLSETHLVTLPLWILRSTADEQAIARRVQSDPETRARAILARGAIARRDYDEAARLLAEAARERDQARGLRELQAFALCMQGRFDEARTALDGVRAPWQRIFDFGMDRSAP